MRIACSAAVLWVSLGLWGQVASAGDRLESVRLPDGVPPVIVAWFWREYDLEPRGFEPYLDMIARHSGANLLATSLRVHLKEVTEPAVHDQIKAAAAYARKYGIKIAMDLDIRLARRAFERAHSDELQEMLRLRELPLKKAGRATLRTASQDLSDHYTGRTTHYIPLAGRLVRVYSYVRGADGIDPKSVRDITETRCRAVEASAKAVVVEIAGDAASGGRTACVMVGFTHLTPAVFAPHVIPFQRQIIEQYRGAGLAGVCKDEWGFPPCFDGCPAKNDYWFSTYRAAAYAKRTGGRDLLRDCVLMTYGERGHERERQAAINHFLAMSTARNGAIEDDFYRTTKAVFGPKAVVATHPTWYPYPGTREFKKNGLDWWIATRDLAQIDEVTPYCVRTSLAKKWGSGVWYNMYYSRHVDDYRREIWSHALGGGRIDFHPVYPQQGKPPRYERYKAILRGGIARGDCRIRLLNFISTAPLDCPVAVIFGHACAMNWAGPAYDDVGVGVADGLWCAGFPADLIPSSEIHNGSLKIDDDGVIQYGPQRYRAAVLYHPEFEPPATAAWFQKATAFGPTPNATALFRVGTWTRGFDGKTLDGNGKLPSRMTVLPDGKSAVARVTAYLREVGIAPQTPASVPMTRFHRRSTAPPAKGRCRLVDGTIIMVAGQKDASGDPIQTELAVDGRRVTVEAVGVVGVRLSRDGKLAALAAGGLKAFEGGGVNIDLAGRVDVAIWRDAGGKIRGVIQGWNGPIPPALTAITKDWLPLRLPKPL